MKSQYLIAIASLVASSLPFAGGDKVATFTLPSGVKVEITEGAFVAARHKIKGCADAECFVDGRLAYGVFYASPQTYVKNIVASFGGKRHVLDSTQMFDAWGDRPLEYKEHGVRYFGGKCYDPMNCYLRGVFSDAAGGFVAEWRITQGVAQRTVLTRSKDIVVYFLSNIDGEPRN